MKYIYKTLKAFSIFLLMVILFAFWGIGTFLPSESLLPILKIGSLKAQSPKETYTIATYNIAHGQGIKKQPSDWRTKPYTLQKLSELAKQISQANADFVLLQEVDLGSHRTYHIDQAAYLAQKAAYPFLACAVLWDKNYIPFPFFPISNHLGRMKSANCILSKYEIIFHKRYIFEKPKSNPLWYNLGYIDRGAEWVQVRLSDQVLNIINVHLEAFDQNTRQAQAKALIQHIKDMKEAWILGGDFNALPKGATHTGPFEDENIDLSQDTTIDLITQQLSTHEQLAGFTFPSNKPTRQLDHLIGHPSHIVWEKVHTLQDPQHASDHLAILGEFRIITPKPKVSH